MINSTGQAMKFEELMLFPDAGTDAIWYFVPRRPRITMGTGGTAAFRLLKYRLIPTADRSPGGGLLTLEVDLSIPAETAKAALAALRAAPGRADVTLEPVNPERVTCEFRLTPDGPGQDTRVSPEPPHSATAQLSLSTEMSALFEAGMKAGAAPGSVSYRVTLSTRRPAVAAALTINWERASQFFAGRAGAGPIVFSQIQSGVSQLTEQRVIEVVLRTDDASDAGKAMRLAMHEAAVLVAGHMFDPVSGAAPGATTSPDDLPENVLLDDQSYLLRAGVQEGTATYDLSRPRAGELTLAIAETLANILAAVPAAARLPVVEVEEEAWSFEVVVQVLFTPADVFQAVQVTLTYGPREVDLLLTPAQPSARTTFMKADGPNGKFGYRCRAYLTPGAPVEAARPQFDLPLATTNDRIIMINTRDLVQVITLNVYAATPIDQYPQIFVDVKVDVPADAWTAERMLLLNAKNPSASVTFVVAKESSATVQYRARHVSAAGAVIEGAWQTTQATTILVGRPAGAVPTT